MTNTVVVLKTLHPSVHMPELFVGHGSPMNVIEDSVDRRAWQAMGAMVWPQLAQTAIDFVCLGALSDNAGIPVIHLGIDVSRPASEHVALGQQLKELRNCGVLLVARLAESARRQTSRQFAQRGVGCACACVPLRHLLALPADQGIVTPCRWSG